MQYLRIPLDFSNITNNTTNQDQLNCSLQESIAQHLMIIISSQKGEMLGRPKYGSEIWDLEFNQLVKINKWEERVRTSLFEAFSEHEKRLKKIDVTIRLSEVDNDNETTDSYVRRKAVIKVSGIIIDIDQLFNFSTTLYISPLSQ